MKDALKALQKRDKGRADELQAVMIPSSEVKIETLLGKGGTGTVHLASFNGTKVAVKQLIIVNEENIERFRLECLLMKELQHPNVCKLIGVCWDDIMLALCLEFIDGGSLEGRLRNDVLLPRSEKMTWKKQLLRWATEAAMGVQFLHQSRYFDEESNTWKNCIIHRDLKPDNMLVTSGDPGALKLTDFGEARATDDNVTMTMVGTPIYVAPEIQMGDRYGAKADSFSFAMVIVAMARFDKNILEFMMSTLAKQLGRSRRMVSLGVFQRQIQGGWRPAIPVEFYPSLITLIGEMWEKEEDDRPSFDEIVNRLTGEVTEEVIKHEEPLIGSGIVIAPVNQTQRDVVIDKSSKLLQLKAALSDRDELLNAERREKQRLMELKEADKLQSISREKLLLEEIKSLKAKDMRNINIKRDEKSDENDAAAAEKRSIKEVFAGVPGIG